MIYFVCDDVNEKEFFVLEKLKKEFSNFKVTCFVMGKDAGDYLVQNWIEVGCHGWSHSYPPECERRDQEGCIQKGLEALRKYLPKIYGFRAPGFQLVASSYPILRNVGFHFIAHQTCIQSLFDSLFFRQGIIINVHIYDYYGDLIKKARNCGEFNFISEGFD